MLIVSDSYIKLQSFQIEASIHFLKILFLHFLSQLFFEQEAVKLGDSSLPKVKVHATVVLSMLNSYVRRSPRDSRVIGTLLGEVKEDGSVVVRITSYCPIVLYYYIISW